MYFGVRAAGIPALRLNRTHLPQRGRIGVLSLQQHCPPRRILPLRKSARQTTIERSVSPRQLPQFLQATICASSSINQRKRRANGHRIAIGLKNLQKREKMAMPGTNRSLLKIGCSQTRIA